MIFQSVKNLICSKHLRARLKTFSLMKHEGSLIFYHGGIETGLFRILNQPSALERIIHESGTANKQLLISLLDLGTALGEISYRKGKYRLTGPMARALADDLPLGELVRETVLYHADIARNIGTFLIKNSKGDYLDSFGGVIAESSRILEPFIKDFIYHEIKRPNPIRILEIGCGSGDYLKYYVDINVNNRGIAIDADPSVVAIAQQKVQDGDIDRNFTVIHDNILNPQNLNSESFDMVTAFSNMHYFSEEERLKLFETVRRLLNEKGRFLLATGLKSGSLSSSYYNCVFTATRGLHPLPRKRDVQGGLKRAGFNHVRAVNLFGGSFTGFVACM